MRKEPYKFRQAHRHVPEADNNIIPLQSGIPWGKKWMVSFHIMKCILAWPMHSCLVSSNAVQRLQLYSYLIPQIHIPPISIIRCCILIPMPCHHQNCDRSLLFLSHSLDMAGKYILWHSNFFIHNLMTNNVHLDQNLLF